MVEKIYQMTNSDSRTVEMLISDENVHYLHMIFNKGEGLPEHFSNSNVYMAVLKGTLSIGLDDQEIHEYKEGTLLKIPFKTKMNVGNKHDEILELTVVKSPAPSK
ncbi:MULTISPECIES: cupin domain-containing protein [unclassified Clostridium]|uniref:cupin domain-containing protein n=1 Tax=Clostridium TaxID=1485 RepID=UPI0032176710